MLRNRNTRRGRLRLNVAAKQQISNESTTPTGFAQPVPLRILLADCVAWLVGC
jgi:hypothetical protein